MIEERPQLQTQLLRILQLLIEDREAADGLAGWQQARLESSVAADVGDMPR